MDWILCGRDEEDSILLDEAQSMPTGNATVKWQGKETGDKYAGRPRRDTLRTMTSATSDATVGAIVSLRDIDQESDELELDDFEWEGWMRLWISRVMSKGFEWLTNLISHFIKSQPLLVLLHY
jgi:hypothetical protein